MLTIEDETSFSSWLSFFDSHYILKCKLYSNWYIVEQAKMCMWATAKWATGLQNIQTTIQKKTQYTI